MSNVRDLFLLLLNLSQMHDRKRIVELFLDSISALFTPLTFQYRHRKPASGVISFPVSTRKSKFGYIVTADGESFSEEDRTLIHNATQMLALLLERLAFEERIEKERALLQEEADKRLLKLQAGQREKELILSNLAEQVTFIDPEMRIIWANSQVIERHNLYDVEYKGRKCFELYHQLDQPCPDCPVVEAFKTGKTCSGFHKSPDNSYWQVTGIPVSDQNGEVIGVMDTALEITDLVTSRQELQANLSLLRIAGETAKFGGWSVDLSTNRVTWSDQVAIIHEMPIGYSPLIEEGIRFYAPEWRERIAAVFSACTEEGIPYDEEMEIITAKGRRVWVRTIGEAVRDEEGNIVRIQGAFQDIIERKKIEAALKHSEDRYDLAMSVKNEGIWDWNLITNDTYFDKRYYTMAGYQPDDFPGNFQTWAERVHEDDLPPAWQAINAYLNGQSSKFDIEFRFKKKDGQWMWINGKGKIYERDENGKPLCMIGTHTDITDRKLAEEEILNLNAVLEQRVKERTVQLEAVNKELEAFAYSVSHDFRAPLRALDGFSKSLQTNYSDQLDEQGRHYLNRIHNAAIYMSDLIDDLLELSRITRTEIKQQETDISHLSGEIIKELQEAEPERRVEVEIAPGLTARGDQALLRAVMENLLGNAWKFSSKEPQAKIEVGRTNRGGEKTFFVCDNGAGFDKAYTDKLFGAFQRLHGKEEFPGTGIGLATVQRIINRHGGRIWAESEVGKGATFYFTLER